MSADWVLGLWNGVIGLGGLMAIIYCLTNENFPTWQRLIGCIVILFIGAFMIVD